MFFQNIFNNNSNINIEYVVKEFLDTYYSRISTLGVNGILYLFSLNAYCTINNYQSVGYNGLLLFYLKEKIEKIQFSNVSPQWYSLRNGDILILTHGRLTAINNFGYPNYPVNYSDTILLSNNNGKYEISIYNMQINNI
jgi:hypothetical protein